MRSPTLERWRFGPVRGTAVQWVATDANEMTDDDEPNTRCVNCGYEWAYSGYGDVKPVATCPDCGNKTPTENIDTEEANA